MATESTINKSNMTKNIPFWKKNAVLLFLIILFSSIIPLFVVFASGTYTDWSIGTAFLIAVVLSAIVTIGVVNLISNNLYELNQWMHEVISGNLYVKKCNSSLPPIQSLIATFQLLVNYLENIRDASHAIARGDYSKKLSDNMPEKSLEFSIHILKNKISTSGIMAERHLNFLNNVPMPIIIMSRKLEVEYINLAAEKLFNKPISKCLGVKCKNLMKSDVCQAGNCMALKVIQTGMKLTTVANLNIDNRIIPVRYINLPVNDSEDNTIGVMKFIMDITREMTLLNLAKTISKGDYTVEIQSISEDDSLSHALNLMTQTLRNVTEENHRQNWIKTGQTELNIRLRGEQDIQSLAENIVFFICDYINSPIGVIYTEKEGILKLISSYAYTNRKSLNTKFEMGEGLVGQAALEKKTIVITQVPQDYMTVRSGLGEKKPVAVIVVPLLFHDKVLGIMEFGLFKDFSQTQIDFLEMIAEPIAVAINTAKARTRMSTLLAHSQNQAEELKVQQEELRQAYEDLEEQTNRLKESEASLQQQHEELSQSNKALEQQTQLLEKQKEDIHKTNEALEKQQILIQEKARDLEIANQYKSEFLANMSHELRTPLNSILLLSGIIAENKEQNLTDKQIEFSNTINMCGTDLLNLINEVLDLSKVESGKMDLYPEHIYIQDIVSVMKKTFEPIADQKLIEFHIIVEPALPVTIFTDQQRLEQVIKNLLSNAFKFTHNGEISLSIKRPEDYHITEKMKDIPKDQLIVFEVTDTGVGISDDKHQLIFEAFHQGDGTTKRRYGGTGLGLSIVKKIVTLMGGQIELKSTAGKGSTFWIIIPQTISIEQDISAMNTENVDTKIQVMTEDFDIRINAVEKVLETKNSNQTKENQLPEKKIAAPQTTIKKMSQKTVLIVSTNDMITNHLQEIVSKQGFLPQILFSAHEALNYCIDNSPNGIILDLALPDWTCWYFYYKYQQNKKIKSIPIHWVSGLNFQTPENQERLFFLKQNDNNTEVKSVIDKINAYRDNTVECLLFICPENSLMMNFLVNELTINCVHKDSLQEAVDYLNHHSSDAIILDTSFISVKNMTSIADLAKKAKQLKLPAIFITDADIWEQEWILPEVDQDGEIQEKSFNVMEKMTDETLLFFHRLKKDDQSQLDNTVVVHDKDFVLKGKKFLLVDDDMRNVFAISSVLEARGSTVIVGRNGKEGMNCLNEHSDIDLVLMDIMMPEMDGYEAITKIREKSQYQKLPIIALTAKAMKKDREKCIEVGADDYMPKPVYPDKLISMLRLWLNK